MIHNDNILISEFNILDDNIFKYFCDYVLNNIISINFIGIKLNNTILYYIYLYYIYYIIFKLRNINVSDLKTYLNTLIDNEKYYWDNLNNSSVNKYKIQFKVDSIIKNNKKYIKIIEAFIINSINKYNIYNEDVSITKIIVEDDLDINNIDNNNEENVGQFLDDINEVINIYNNNSIKNTDEFLYEDGDIHLNDEEEY